MKHIVVKSHDSVKVYTSGTITETNENGERVEVLQTDQEMYQACYESLMDDVKRREFEKHLIFTISNYLREGQMDSWTNIAIDISYSTDRVCKINIGNRENIQWQTVEVPQMELPEK